MTDRACPECLDTGSVLINRTTDVEDTIPCPTCDLERRKETGDE